MKKEELIIILQQSINIILEVECLEALNSENSIFKMYNRGLDKERQYLTLKRRFESASGDNLIGVEDSLSKLKEYKFDSVILAKLSTDTSTYSIYLTKDRKSILCIFKNNGIGRNEFLDLEQQYLNRGFKDIVKWKSSDNL